MKITLYALVLAGILVALAARSAAADPVTQSWFAQAQHDLTAREYRVTRNDRGLQAPNRAQGFRTYFDAHGVTLVARDAVSAPLATMALSGIGRDAQLQEPGQAQPSADGARVTFEWLGVTARYDNRAEGLSQEFTVLQRPSGKSPLAIAIALGGGVAAVADHDLMLRSDAGNLRMGPIVASDANGHTLALAIRLDHDQLALSIDDRLAQYPIKVTTVIKGLFVAPLQSNQANALFGSSVAAAGDVNGDGYGDIIIGAYQYDNGQTDEGAAFLYFGGPGTLGPTADAQLEANQANALFGYDVAGAGDVNGDGYADVIVGAYKFDNGQADEGAAFVYFGGPGAFNTTADALLESNQASAFFGISVSGAGDVNGDGYADVIIGASTYDNGQTDEGAAFLFFGGAGIFNAIADAQLEANQAGANFGRRVAGAGDVNGDGRADVIVGAYTYDNGQTDEGAAFLYFGGSGAFNTVVDAQLESNQASAAFGLDVAGAGDVNGDGYADLLVGAPFYDNGQTNEGAAFVYFGGAGAFNTTSDALLEANQADAQFGISVAGAGDVNGDGYGDIIIGAYLYDNGQPDEGAAYLFLGGPGAFDTTAGGRVEVNQAGAFFGRSVAGAGDINGDGLADVIVGANLYDDGETNEGAAFLYVGGALSFSGMPDAQLEVNQASALLGGVAGVGDVNGDGFSDVIVCAVLYDNGQADEGAAFLYFGGAGSFDTNPDALLEVNQAGSQFCVSADGAGDVNGDGFADIIVGANFYENGQTAEGAAFIYFGGAGAFDTTPDAVLESNRVNSVFGNSVAGAGDINGDGFADVIVGAYNFSNGQPSEGAAFVYFGGAGAFDTTADAQLEGEQANAQFGISVSGAGDVNGDGFADVIVGSYLYDHGESDEGAAFLYFGGAGAFDATADALLEANQAFASFGISVGGAGDLNGDGYADVAVGASDFDDGQTNEGAVFVYFGGSGPFNTAPDAVLELDQADAGLGASVAAAGDVNGDGYGDLIVGAPYFDNGENEEGAALLYYGSPDAFTTTPGILLEANQADAAFGLVAAAGDVNGDGFADVIVGAIRFDNGQTDEGAAFLYYGSARGRPVVASQFRGDASAPVEPWGLSERDDGFVVSLQATSPRGRERVRLQAEICPNGRAFGAPQCEIRTSVIWFDVGTNPQGINLAFLITGLTFNRVYHWRARLQYAPFTVTAPGITAPPKPTVGPWRRLQAGARVAEIRTGISDRIFADGFE